MNEKTIEVSDVAWTELEQLCGCAVRLAQERHRAPRIRVLAGVLGAMGEAIEALADIVGEMEREGDLDLRERKGRAHRRGK